MAYEHNEGFGAIFKNKKKEEGTKQPDYNGNIMLGGKVWELAGWIKTGDKGSYLSLKGQEPREREEAKPKAKDKTAHGLDDQIPF